MPYATCEGRSLYYEVDGNPEASTVAFVGEIGFGAWQWGWQHAAVAGPYESLVYDSRGIGNSDAPPGPYRLGGLVADLEAVLADAGVRKAHLVGCGLGGMVGLSAADNSTRVESLAVVGTPPSGDGFDPEPLWAPPDDREALRSSVCSAVSREFSRRQPDVVESIVEWRSQEDADRRVWEAQRAAIEEFDVEDRLHELTLPTLVIHGDLDDQCPPSRGRALAEGLPRGVYEPVPDAAHLVHVEASRRVNDRLLAWLDERRR
ncbi:3-oxoadipate enol-lactonase [Halalkaliarchaeum desulfuricum]|uniref:3-oxoadipate enol-lactonase n=1 Tax=Halalkaliarchaeum desulfuricum TaxID=2055893 RepID=A0A343TGJ6_9EURY|nr:alpha/beta fold hydrolase [Halalkaliarchaeum desulfuricum]AUX08218.1 3-oxoadipate enol-lactonase [Halalkaliarchaeum desulfuricum]